MKRNVFLGLLVFVLVFGFIGCGGDNGNNCSNCKKYPCECVVEQEIEKTHTITLKGGDLEFDVIYKSLPSATAPEYLAYIETRLYAFVNSSEEDAVYTTSYLISKGNKFIIEIEYIGNEYSGMFWDNTSKIFIIHNSFISNATGTDLRFVMIEAAFMDVEL